MAITPFLFETNSFVSDCDISFILLHALQFLLNLYRPSLLNNRPDLMYDIVKRFHFFMVLQRKTNIVYTSIFKIVHQINIRHKKNFIFRWKRNEYLHICNAVIWFNVKFMRILMGSILIF